MLSRRAWRHPIFSYGVRVAQIHETQGASAPSFYAGRWKSIASIIVKGLQIVGRLRLGAFGAGMGHVPRGAFVVRGDEGNRMKAIDIISTQIFSCLYYGSRGVCPFCIPPRPSPQMLTVGADSVCDRDRAAWAARWAALPFRRSPSGFESFQRITRNSGRFDRSIQPLPKFSIHPIYSRWLKG